MQKSKLPIAWAASAIIAALIATAPAKAAQDAFAFGYSDYITNVALILNGGTSIGTAGFQGAVSDNVWIST